MRVAELTDARLVVELSEWDLWELERSFGVCLPGGTWLIPGRMAASDGFCARADEMRVRGADGAFTGDGLDDTERLVVAEAVCSLWPWVCDSCDVRFVGEDGELWCRGDHHLKVEVRALRSSAVLWTLLATLVGAAELALSLLMGALEGVYGVMLINVLLAPFSLFCAAVALRSWRFGVTADLGGMTVRPTLGPERSIAFSEVTSVERVVSSDGSGALRRLVVRTADARVSLSASLEGIEALDALLAERVRPS